MLTRSSNSSFAEDLLIAYARGFPLRRGKLRVTNALWRAAAGDRGTARVAKLKRGGLLMPCDLEEMLQRQFYFFGTYFLEDDLLDCWAEAAKASSTILDIGANTGIYSLTALASQPAATVHAFEPTPEIVEALRATRKLNGLERLHVHEAAVSDETGELVLRRFRGETGENGGMNFVVRAEGAPDVERVACICLDQFCTEQGIERIDLMKLDVQGHEPAVLGGAGRLLEQRLVGTVFMELNWAADPSEFCSASAAVGLLAREGYVFSEPGPTMNFRAPGDWMRVLSDVVARSP